MKTNNEISIVLFILCIIFAFVGLIIVIIIAPYAIDAIDYHLQQGLDPTIFIMLFIFAFLFTLMFSAYAMFIFLKRKKETNTSDDVNSESPKIFGKYDKDRKYLENRINELSEQLVSTQKRWEEAYHLIVSSSVKNFSNSGKLSSNEFLSKYNINPDKIEIDKKLVFILTPFNDNSIGDFHAIRIACNESGLLAIRGDEEATSGDIFFHIINFIAKSQIVIANINGRNPNVFYELGIAHMMNKSTILVSRMGQEIPFDIQPMHVIFYDSVEELRIKIREALKPFSKENGDIVYNTWHLNSVSEVTQKVKGIIRVYRDDPSKKQQVIEMLRPLFSTNSEAKKKIIIDNEFRAGFRQRLGKRNMSVLKTLLLILDNDHYKNVIFF
jgi:hypothetical protein